MKNIYNRYPHSQSCSCEVCKSFCKRPGWWTPEQTKEIIKVGYYNKIMLEISPELTFGVLSPAFKGCEMNIAINLFKENWCTFYHNGLCDLHNTPYLPLECAFCNHDSKGQGQKCHTDIEQLWKSKENQKIIKEWGEMVGLWERLRRTVSLY